MGVFVGGGGVGGEFYSSKISPYFGSDTREKFSRLYPDPDVRNNNSALATPL